MSLSSPSTTTITTITTTDNFVSCLQPWEICNFSRLAYTRSLFCHNKRRISSWWLACLCVSASWSSTVTVSLSLVLCIISDLWCYDQYLGVRVGYNGRKKINIFFIVCYFLSLFVLYVPCYDYFILCYFLLRFFSFLAVNICFPKHWRIILLTL